MKILDPTAPAPARTFVLPAPLPSLRGERLAVLNNKWKSMDRIAERLAERLPADYGMAEVLVETVPLNGGTPPTTLDSVAARARVAVVGLAN